KLAKLISLKNFIKLQAFLELASYYQKFIENFSKKAAPLFKLLQKDIKFTRMMNTNKYFTGSNINLLLHQYNNI
ncbi:7377_t:CDS:1, partial [Racocetra fulgida]